MELNTFITESLSQIINGVKQAQVHAFENDAVINPMGVVNASRSSTLVDRSTGSLLVSVGFDVAVTIDESTNTKGGIGVAVGVIAFGGQGQTENANTSTSKISFSVPMILPRMPHSEYTNDEEQEQNEFLRSADQNDV